MTARLWTRNGFVDDGWRHASPGEAIADGMIVALADWLALDPVARPHLGVRVKPGEAIEPLLAHLDDIALIALEFPAFSDGRSYSRAERLRGRLGYTGILRAVGDVLTDQIPHMLRTGFDELEVSNGIALARLAERRIDTSGTAYQPSAGDGGKAAGYAWRRASSE